MLIEVRHAGLNFADTHQRTDSYVAKAELPLVPGSEVAGIRNDTGERVIALTGHGGYAQYAIAPAKLTWPIPDGVDDGAALALLLQGLTAWHMYTTCAHVKPGESVVVHAAAGGVGSLAVQLARHFEAGRVIATASSEDKRETARGSAPSGHRRSPRGPDRPATGVQRRPRGRRRVRDGRRRVVRAVTARVAAVRAGGRVRDRHGREEHGLDRAPAAPLPLGDRLLAVPLPRSAARDDRPAARRLFELAAHGELRPLVGETYPLAERAHAHTDLAGRRTTGKLLLDPWA